jgi:prophage regulatory protein
MSETPKRPTRATVPETGFMRKPAVLSVVPMSATSLWRACKRGAFPAPVRLSERITAWRAEDVRDWIQAQGRKS